MVQERFYEFNKQKHQEIVFFYLIKIDDSIEINEGSFTDQGTDETLHWLPLDGLGRFDTVPRFLKTKSFESMDRIEHVVVNEC